jgi:hypothetical protein
VESALTSAATNSPVTMSRPDATLSALGEHVGEDGCLADVASLSCGQQGEPSLTGQHAKMGERRGALWIAELSAIAAREFGIPVGIMAVPLPQLGGGRDLLAPLVEADPLLAEPPRPEPVDQDPLPVLGLRRVVHPTKVHLRCLLHQVRPAGYLFAA